MARSWRYYYHALGNAVYICILLALPAAAAALMLYRLIFRGEVKVLWDWRAWGLIFLWILWIRVIDWPDKYREDRAGNAK
jgi:hypothetical protein